jgi:hypothetical protein
MLLDMDTRLRVARAIEKDETQASIGVFQMLKRRGHPDGPPPTISDGWGGIGQAMIEVYGKVPEYCGCGRPPTLKKPGEGWLYLQMVKQHDEDGRFTGTELKAIFGTLEELTHLLGETTAYIERSNLPAAYSMAAKCARRWRFPKMLIVIVHPQPGKTTITISSSLTRACGYGSRMFQAANGSREPRPWLPA